MKAKDFTEEQQNFILKEKNKSLVDGARHSVPSPLTNKIFSKMQKEIGEIKTNQKLMNQRMEFIVEKMDDTHDLIKKQIKYYADSCDEFEESKADKWVEKAITLVMSTVAISIIGALMVLILK